MTDERMFLQALFQTIPDADFLRQMIGFAAQRLIALEVGSMEDTSKSQVCCPCEEIDKSSNPFSAAP